MKAERIKQIDQKNLPPTYTHNSEREELVLDYADQFETQFLSQFPTRKPLYISPLNEAGIQKFVCTTLRPGLLSNPELCDGNVLASFVSNSIDYEPLEDQTKFDPYLVAPQTTLEW